MALKGKLRGSFLAGALGCVLAAPCGFAHTLPISYLFVVTDADYVHLELSFNPFELSNFAEYDANHDLRLDAMELGSVEPQICRQLLDHLKLRVNDQVVPAETSGLSPEGDTHHATLRAHYRVDARHAKLALESALPDITSSSHLTQVNFLRDGKRALAQLDSRSRGVAFVTPAGARCDPTMPPDGAQCARASSRGEMVAMSVGFAVVLLLGLKRARSNASRETVTTHSHTPHKS